MTDQEARPAAQQHPNQPSQPAPPPVVARRSGTPHALSPIAEADAREEAERRRQLMTLGLEVALAVLVTFAARIWSWVREERARARVNRGLRRRIPAT